VITYRATLGVPLQVVLKVSSLLKKHRAEPGTRNGTRALICWQQAKFVLAWFRDKPDLCRLGQGFGISQSIACRYKDEGVEVLAREAPSLEQALGKAAEQGIAYVILDGARWPTACMAPAATMAALLRHENSGQVFSCAWASRA
jgi:hypothetical protein